jgi:hypothetical protein
VEKTKNIDFYRIYKWHDIANSSIWKPSPASPRREWMESLAPFIYRCLPLTMANQNGWVLESPCKFSAVWDGGPGVENMSFEFEQGFESLKNNIQCYFGGGIITFIFDFFIKTSEKTNLLVRGAPNFYVDNAQALEGLVETDWLNFTFTMNWKVILPNKPVLFNMGDPICFLQPVPHNYAEEFNFNLLYLEDNPELREKFEAYSQSRGNFIRENNDKRSKGIKISTNESWQKHYFNGVEVIDNKKVSNDVHSIKLNLSEPKVKE